MMHDKYPTYVPPVMNWNSQIEQQNKEGEQEQPKTEEKPENKEPAKGSGDLGESGELTLQKEREARKAAEKELAKFRADEDKRKKAEMSEVDRFKAENTDLTTKLTSTEQELAKYKIGVELKLDPALIKRLQGTTEEEIREDAKELVKLNPGAKLPKADPSQGRKESTSGLSPKDQFNDAIEDLFDKH